jgi:hypothetical protein
MDISSGERGREPSSVTIIVDGGSMGCGSDRAWWARAISTSDVKKTP